LLRFCFSNVFFAFRRASFFCVAKRKKPKKKLPRCRFFPSFLAPHLGGCETRAFSTQTVLAAFHLLAQAEGAAKGIESQNLMNAPQNRCSDTRMDIGLQGIYFQF
jgi:hypothetical protein